MLVTELLSERAERESRRDWWRSAACRAADPDIFFPVSAHGPGGEDIARAKAVCARCPVRKQCLQFALATHQTHGVWGGTTEDERRLQMDAEQAVPQPAVPAPRLPARPEGARTLSRTAIGNRRDGRISDGWSGGAASRIRGAHPEHQVDVGPAILVPGSGRAGERGAGHVRVGVGSGQQG